MDALPLQEDTGLPFASHEDGKMHACGHVPETATLTGTVRTVSPDTHRRVLAGIERVARGVADAHGVSVVVEISHGYPVTVNDHDVARFVLDASERVLGLEATRAQQFPQMAAEDFSYVLERVPGAMVSLGTRPPHFGEGEAPNAHSNPLLARRARHDQWHGHVCRRRTAVPATAGLSVSNLDPRPHLRPHRLSPWERPG